MISQSQLATIMPHSGRFSHRYLENLNLAMEEFEVAMTAERQRMFLATLAEESGELRYVAEQWRLTPYQQRYERDFSQTWERSNSVNKVACILGNTELGDGQRFLGRGLIPIRGRRAYGECSKALFGGERFLLEKPETLELPQAACRSAGWVWQTKGCNEAADAGDFVLVVQKVSGRLNHYDRRVAFLKTAEQVIV